jgi:hypothetical protein
MNTENNNLIAVFLHGKESGKVHPNQYHENWNEIMQVVEKIEEMSYKVTIEQNFCRIDMFLLEHIIVLESNLKIDAVYNACLSFIKWYNQQKS